MARTRSASATTSSVNEGTKICGPSLRILRPPDDVILCTGEWTAPTTQTPSKPWALQSSLYKEGRLSTQKCSGMCLCSSDLQRHVLESADTPKRCSLASQLGSRETRKRICMDFKCAKGPPRFMMLTSACCPMVLTYRVLQAGYTSGGRACTAG